MISMRRYKIDKKYEMEDIKTKKKQQANRGKERTNN